MAATPSVPIAGSAPPLPPDAVAREPWPARESVEVSFVLRRDPTRPWLLSAEQTGPSLRQRRYLERADPRRRCGAAEEDLTTVRAFAERAGLSVVRASAPQRTVVAAGSSADVAAAFAVTLERFRSAGSEYRAHRGPVQVPAEVAAATRAVLGLSSRPLLRPHFRRNADPAAVGYAAPTVGAAYGFPSSLSGAGATVTLLEFGGGYRPADLEQYFAGIGLSSPAVVAVGVDGASNAPTGDPNGADAEVELDVELVGALAPGAGLVVYFAPNSERGFADALSSAVHDATHAPSVVSISWGGPEESWSAAGRAAFEAVLQDAAAQGVSVVAAAGDQGATDGATSGALEVDFPAASPYVLGCGGTRLELDGTRVVSEVVWNDLASGEGATGGGVSEAYPRPSYQPAANVPDAPNGFAGRGVPDVAADADPVTGYAVVVDGAPAVIGGTSAAAPLWAALLACLGEGVGKPLGYAGPLLYAPALRAGFREITQGNNGGYSAGAGWNACAGLGAPLGTALLAALRA